MPHATCDLPSGPTLPSRTPIRRSTRSSEAAPLAAPLLLALMTFLWSACASPADQADDDQDQDGYTTEQGDCDDLDPSAYPGADEIPYNGIDEDCSGADLTDLDEDGVDAVAAGGTDCDDTDPATYPGATEVCDGVANGCDPYIDDADKDGSRGLACGGSDCDDTDPTINTGATDLPYDGIDQNCDGQDVTDVDGDGEEPVQLGGMDCDDTSLEVTSVSEVFVPAGTFTLGSETTDLNVGSEEKPQVEVYLSGYCIDRWEVTQHEYAACDTCQATASLLAQVEDSTPTSEDLLPMVSVNWSQAVGYCEHVGKTLPTEAQWEKAARGGHCLTGDIEGVACASPNTLSDGEDGSTRTYPWGEEAPTCERTNYAACTSAQSTNPELQPVWDLDGEGVEQSARASGASPYGVYDLAGNASEWVLDTYSSEYYTALSAEETQPPVDPEWTESGSRKTIRGGSYSNDSSEIRTSVRDSQLATEQLQTLGFRCARIIAPLP